MHPKHIYGLAAMLFGLGVVVWMFASVLWWIGLFLLVSGSAALVIGLIRFYLPISQAQHEQQIAWESVRLQERVVAHGERFGGDIKRDANGTIEVTVSRKLARVVEVDEQQPHEDQPEQPQEIPASVCYEDIQSFIPRDHVLVGVGEGGFIDTREKEIKGLIWIPGSSGAGKSNTTALRVEEDYVRGHKFLGIDPHFFKADSLSNLVQPYK